MARRANRRREPGLMAAEVILAWIGLGIVVGSVGSVWAALHLHALVTDTQQDLPLNPFTVVLFLVTGRLSWPPGATGVLMSLLGSLAMLAVAGVVLVRRRRQRLTRVDHAARYMSHKDDVADLTHKGSWAKATRLGVASPGVPIGRTVTTDETLYGSWEDMQIDIWGPRTGKTTSRAIPAITEAPGAVLVTSNKRDVVDGTREVRASRGHPVWVFDPQGIVEESPSWWWNPLSYVTDEVKAAELAGHFAAGSRKADAQADAYFEPAGRDLLSGLLLAAALDRRAITEVYTWLTRPDDATAVDILSAHDYKLQADGVASAVNAPDKQRAGIFGTAVQMAQCLTNRRVAKWITPDSTDDPRPQFDPAAFLAEGGTLYSLSREGRGTAGPLVTALTVAVVDAAEEHASQSPGGRLPVPLLGVLDEVANVCKWAELPNMYSHYGSRGIVLMAILQSWSQGVEVWGREGMRKLWSAANIKVYGGGVGETEFLQELSQLVGDYDMNTVSVSSSKDGRSATQQLRRETTLSVADLGALPRGRAIVLASGAPPTLVKTTPWMQGSHADAIRNSLAIHDPGTP